MNMYKIMLLIYKTIFLRRNSYFNNTQYMKRLVTFTHFDIVCIKTTNQGLLFDIRSKFVVQIFV